METIEADPSVVRQTIDERLRDGLFDVQIRLDQTIEWALIHKKVTGEQVAQLREASQLLDKMREELDSDSVVEKGGF